MTCGDLQRLSKPTLERDFGVRTGSQLYNYCRGLDDREVISHHERKSVSAEVNYGIRFGDEKEMKQFFTGLAGELSQRLIKLNTQGKSLTLKLKVIMTKSVLTLLITLVCKI